MFAEAQKPAPSSPDRYYYVSLVQARIRYDTFHYHKLLCRIASRGGGMLCQFLATLLVVGPVLHLVFPTAIVGVTAARAFRQLQASVLGALVTTTEAAFLDGRPVRSAHFGEPFFYRCINVMFLHFLVGWIALPHDQQTISNFQRVHNLFFHGSIFQSFVHCGIRFLLTSKRNGNILSLFPKFDCLYYRIRPLAPLFVLPESGIGMSQQVVAVLHKADRARTVFIVDSPSQRKEQGEHGSFQLLIARPCGKEFTKDLSLVAVGVVGVWFRHDSFLISFYTRRSMLQRKARATKLL